LNTGSKKYARNFGGGGGCLMEGGHFEDGGNLKKKIKTVSRFEFSRK
jgi:hypothetical protein